MNLLDNEHQLTKWNNGAVTLTNLRIREQRYQSVLNLVGSTSTTSQDKKNDLLVSASFLEQISAIKFKYVGQPWFLVLAGIFLLPALAMLAIGHFDIIFLVLVVLSIVFLSLFLFYRVPVLRIYSPNGTVSIWASGMSYDEITAAIDLIEEAKEARVRSIYSVPYDLAVDNKLETIAVINCPLCNFENGSDALFCENCGHKLQ